MADSGAWYLKMNDGTVYGPADLNRLQAWARGGRVAPSGQISSDLKSWVPASRMPELGMEWLVEVEQGQYYGPFHPDVIRDLIAQKRIPASARQFRLDTGRAQEDHSKALNVALEKAKASLAEKDAALAKANVALTERESVLAKARTLLGEKDAALAELKAALAEQKTLVAGLRGQEAGLAAKLEMSLDASRSATAASALRIGELEAALKTERVHAEELEAALTKSKSEAAASLVRAEDLEAALKMERVHVSELGAALDAEHVRVENLLAQLVAAAEREKVLRTDLDLAHKTAASERKCVEAAIRKQRQTEKELEGARKDAEDLRVKVQKAKEQSKAAKGKGGLFQGASAADLAFLEQAARRELASARGRSASVPRPRSKALDVIDV